ncbi:MAG: hypothetical protein MUO39_02645 [Steroidobacteraceae bacterium]|nr:hypothetical protein [Steroidobacteraceae bacterium]
MKTWQLTRILGSLAVMAVLAAGCGRGTGVTVYEPGVYKGAAYTVKFTPQLQSELQERCRLGQSDR